MCWRAWIKILTLVFVLVMFGLIKVASGSPGNGSASEISLILRLGCFWAVPLVLWRRHEILWEGVWRPGARRRWTTRCMLILLKTINALLLRTRQSYHNKIIGRFNFVQTWRENAGLILKNQCQLRDFSWFFHKSPPPNKKKSERSDNKMTAFAKISKSDGLPDCCWQRSVTKVLYYNHYISAYKASW